MDLYICCSKICFRELMSLIRRPSTMVFSHGLLSSLHALIDRRNIKLVSAKDNVIKYFVYNAAHTKPETKLSAIRWRLLRKLSLF